MQLPNSYYGAVVSYPTTTPPTSTTNHHQGLCPTGWHVPSGGVTSEQSEFLSLDIANNGVADNTAGSPAHRYLFRPTHPWKLQNSDIFC